MLTQYKTYLLNKQIHLIQNLLNAIAVRGNFQRRPGYAGETGLKRVI